MEDLFFKRKWLSVLLCKNLLVKLNGQKRYSFIVLINNRIIYET